MSLNTHKEVLTLPPQLHTLSKSKGQRIWNSLLQGLEEKGIFLLGLGQMSLHVGRYQSSQDSELNQSAKGRQTHFPQCVKSISLSSVFLVSPESHFF